jgi:hypothetical protein
VSRKLDEILALRVELLGKHTEIVVYRGALEDSLLNALLLSEFEVFYL